jgi:predicted metal-dependent phosphoesterase TrpH
MRCDLHVHSIHSGPVNLPVLRRYGHECYSEPRDVYALARRRGMDLVTLTDHDSIEGAERLLSLPGTFVSEELTCELPGGRVLHLGVFGLDARQHQALQARRADPEALFAYLAEQRLPACVNHLFGALTGPRDLSDVQLVLQHVDLVEARNGMQPAENNEHARRAGVDHGLAAVGGSDAHALGSVARAWTEIPEATNAAEFLAGLRAGLSIPCGRSGSYARLTRDVLAVCAHAYAAALRGALDGPAQFARGLAMLASAPIFALVPIVSVPLYLKEVRFGARLWRRYASRQTHALARSTRRRASTPVPMLATQVRFDPQVSLEAASESHR